MDKGFHLGAEVDEGQCLGVERLLEELAVEACATAYLYHSLWGERMG